MSITTRKPRPPAPVPQRPIEPSVHQWGYERVQSTIAPTLAPKPRQWPWLIAALIGVAVFAVGVGMLRNTTTSTVLIIIGCVGVGVVGTWAELRARRRQDRVDRLIEHIAPLVSTYLTRSTVTASRWRGSHPARLVVRYNRGALSTPDLLPELRAAFAAHFSSPYELIRQKDRTCRMIFAATDLPVEAVVEEGDPVAERALRVATKLFSGRDGDGPQIELGHDEDGRLAQIFVRHNIGIQLTSATVRNDRAKRLGVLIPGRWKADWDLEADTVTFTLRPELPTLVAHPPIEMTEATAQERYHEPIAYGVDENGEAMAWRPWLDPMMMITGKTGRGKTVVAHSLLVELAARKWIIDVSDAKLVEFIGYKDWPNVRCVGAVLEEQVRLVHYARELMRERYESIVEGKAGEDDFQPYVLFLDEYTLFREDIVDWYADIKQKGDPAKAPTTRMVNAVLRAGRTARVHIVLLAQRPDAELLGSGEPRLQLSCRVSMGQLDFEGARMMWLNPSIGIAVPTNIRGRGMTRNEAGDIVEFQAYWTPDPRKNKSPDDKRILGYLRPDYSSHDKMKILLPPPHNVEVGDELVEIPATYQEIATCPIVPLDEAPDELEELPAVEEESEGDIPPQATDEQSPRAVLNLVRATDEDPVPTPIEPSPAQPAPDERIATVTSLRAHRTRSADRASATTDDRDEFEDLAVVPIERVPVGARVLLDEDADAWGICTDSVPDDVDEGCWVLSCTSDDGEDETFVAEEGELMSIHARSEATPTNELEAQFDDDYNDEDGEN